MKTWKLKNPDLKNGQQSSQTLYLEDDAVYRGGRVLSIDVRITQLRGGPVLRLIDFWTTQLQAGRNDGEKEGAEEEGEEEEGEKGEEKKKGKRRK